MKIFLAIIILTVSAKAQIETANWEKVEQDYRVKNAEAEYQSSVENEQGIFSLIRDFYSFTISDLDGDNCPFHPSCSVFFVRAAKTESLPKAVLMFADRFTRDTNFLKVLKEYPMHAAGKFYDPVHNYTLDNSTIKYLPKEKIYHNR